MSFNQQNQHVKKQINVEGNYTNIHVTDNTKVLAEAKIKRHRGEIVNLEYDKELIKPPISFGMGTVLFCLGFVLFIFLAFYGIISLYLLSILFFVSIGIIWVGVKSYNSQEVERKKAFYNQKIEQLIKEIAKQKKILEQQDIPVPILQSKPIKESTIKILFLAANPIDPDKARLRLDEESRSVEEALRKTDFGFRFEIKQHWAVRISDIQGFLLRYQPDIVHFCSHGSERSEIILEDNLGRSYPVPVEALSKLFSILKDNIKCIVLNACYSKKQAEAISKNIDCVIGMSNEIGDVAGIHFVTSFYQGLGYGKNVQTAFDLGCNQISLEGINEQKIPRLFAKRCNPENIVFAHNHDT